MTLHAVGPVDMTDDERKIGKGYVTWLPLVYGVVPFAIAAYVPDVKWLVAYGIAALTINAHEAGGRLHDLCIRLRRTNLLLRDHFTN